MKIAQLIICSLVSIGAFAQTFRGNLAGVVTDTSEAAISSATISLESPLNGLKRVTLSSDTGGFLFAELPVGIYTLTVSLKGFEIRKIENVEVAVSKTTSLVVQLGVAHQQEIVTVSASQVALETKSSDLAVVVDTRTVNDLPINGRDFRELFKMAPGVQAANNPGNISVNG